MITKSYSHVPVFESPYLLSIKISEKKSGTLHQGNYSILPVLSLLIQITLNIILGDVPFT